MLETTPFAAALASTSCRAAPAATRSTSTTYWSWATARAAPDLITDFVHGLDRIDLYGIDANARLAGNQAFAFLGSSSFTAHAGELITRAYQSATYLLADVNGDGHADMQIQFVGHINFAASDFIL